MQCDGDVADPEKREKEESLVPGAHRVIRMLDAHEGAFGGALVTRGDGVAVCKSAEALGGWAGWGYSGSEHVAAPIDLVRRGDGQDVLLPWCTDRVAVFLGRRTAAGALLSAGEVGTLVGSMLRGIGELHGGDRLTGDWWITDDGRPVFAIGEGREAHEAAAHLVEMLREGVSDRALHRVLSAIQSGLETGHVPPLLHQRWERDLFEVAAPKPLQREIFPAERAGAIAVTRASRRNETLRAAPEDRAEATWRDGASWPQRGAARLRELLSRGPEAAGERSSRTRSEHHAGERGGTVAERLIAWWRARTAKALSVAGALPSGSGERGPRRSAPRRRAVLVAGTAAGAVLAAGLLWPGNASSDAGAKESPAIGALKTPPPRAVADPLPSGASRSSAARPSDPALEDPVAAAARLLAVIAECSRQQDARCAAGVVEGAGAAVTRLGEIRSESAALALVDEYGDVAVVRLTPNKGGEPEEIVVLERDEESWLVRDAYAVANQPG